MKKRSLLVLMFSIWGVAFLSCAALAYALNRPLAVVAVVAEPPARAVETESTSEPSVADPIEMRMPAERIVGHVASVTTPRIIRCTDWQDLTQGPAGQKVRYCE